MFQSDTLSMTVYITNEANFESMHFVQISNAIFLEFWNISKAFFLHFLQILNLLLPEFFINVDCNLPALHTNFVCILPPRFTNFKFIIPWFFTDFRCILPAVFTNFKCITPWVFTNFECALPALLTNLLRLIPLVFTNLDTVKMHVTHYSVPGHSDVLPRRHVPTTRTNKLRLSSRQNNIRKRWQDCTRSDTVPSQNATVSKAGTVRNTDLEPGYLVSWHRAVWGWAMTFCRKLLL